MANLDKNPINSSRIFFRCALCKFNKHGDIDKVDLLYIIIRALIKSSIKICSSMLKNLTALPSFQYFRQFTVDNQMPILRHCNIDKATLQKTDSNFLSSTLSP